MIGVNSDGDLATIQKVVKEQKINWRSFQNKPEVDSTPISSNWAVRGWPTLIVIDADFKIRYRGHSGDEATRMVRKLLLAMAPEDEPQPKPPEVPNDPAIQEF